MTEQIPNFASRVVYTLEDLRAQANSIENNYLSLSSASSTYLNLSSASSTYLTISNASSVYLPIESASNIYLEKNSASSTYLSQSDAINTYLTINSASSTYLVPQDIESKIDYNIINAKGDLIVGISSASTFTLPIGEEGYALVSASAEPTGIKWAIPAAGAKGGALDKIFWENDTSVTASYTISSGKNAGTFGPVEIQSGVTVEIPEGSVWVIV